MNRVALPLLGLVALSASACTGSPIGYSGYDMPDHFPLDGKRSWEYSNPATTWKLNVVMLESSEIIENAEVKTLEYYDDVNGMLLMRSRWSSDSSKGILLYSYEVLAEGGQGGGDTGTDDSGDTGDTGGAMGPAEAVTFDPPIQFGDRNNLPQESIVTETAGGTWTSTFEAVEKCPNNWVGGDNTWDCLRVVLDDGDGDSTTGAKIAGTYWIAPRYGMSWFQLTGDADKWILNRAEWEE
ncbi:hypothetical protein L6R49_11080 [Myxococcota bacterium]|nr:hypothetical protein [Myxococcota bacterium]